MTISLFILLFRLMFQPAQAWKRLAEIQEKDNENFYKSYLFSFWGIIALSAFLGTCIHLRGFDVSTALKVVLAQVLVYVISFYASSSILSYLWRKQAVVSGSEIQGSKEIRLISERFVGYASAWIYFTAAIAALLPGMPWLTLFMFLSYLTIPSGTRFFLKGKEKPDFIPIFVLGMIIIPVPVLLANGAWYFFWGM